MCCVSVCGSGVEREVWICLPMWFDGVRGYVGVRTIHANICTLVKYIMLWCVWAMHAVGQDFPMWHVTVCINPKSYMS